MPLAESFKGAAFYIAGTADPFTPPEAARIWFETGPQGTGRPRRSLFVELEGIGHFGTTDATHSEVIINFCGFPTFGNVIGADQHRWHRLLVTTALRAELGRGPFDDDALYCNLMGPENPPQPLQLLGGGQIHDGVTISSYCAEPISFVHAGPETLGLYVAAREADAPQLQLFLPSWFLLPPGVPIPGFQLTGFTRFDPHFPMYMGVEPAYTAGGIMNIDLPVLLSGFQVGFGWHVPRPEGSVVTDLMKVIL